jgi:molybdate transport system ATP-binding protein
MHYDDVTLTLPGSEAQPSSARNRLTGRIVRALPVGSMIRVTVDCGFPLSAIITRRSWEELGLETGRKVVAAFKAASVHLLPRH